MADDQGYPFLKGHGTENDFVLLPDHDGTVHGELAAERVRALCDRRAGIGGDGVLRVIRTSEIDAGRGQPAEWFMDYRNSDGSLSEMCGNGIRVFGRHLAIEGLADPTAPLPIGTRAGVKTLTFAGGAADGEITVDMGTPKVLEETEVSVVVSGVERRWPASHIDMGNPHAVAWVDDLADAGPLYDAPVHDETTFGTASTWSSSYDAARPMSRCASTSAAPARPARAAPAPAPSWLRPRSPTTPHATPTTGSTSPAAPSASAGPPTTGS